MPRVSIDCLAHIELFVTCQGIQVTQDVQNLQGRGEVYLQEAQGPGSEAGQPGVPAPLPVHIHCPLRVRDPRLQL